MLAVLQDIGNILLRYLTRVYNTCRRYFWKMGARNYKISDIANNDAEYKDVEFPLKLFVLITAIYLVICTIIVLIIYENRNISSGMTFGDAFYFCNGYKKLEHCLINAAINLELFFERLLRRSEGRIVFQWLAPNIELLIITLPIFDDNIISRDEVLQPTNDSCESNNDRSTLQHESTLGIFSSASSNNNYKENMQLKYDMGILPKIDDIYDLNSTVQKKFIRRALTYTPGMQNVRRIRTMSDI
ncbi:DIS3-like exonuclease [Dirofilaria immitis]